MSKFKRIYPLLIILGVALIFFAKTIFGGLVPFPGDLLLAEYKPWRTASYGGYIPGSIPHKAQYPDVIRQLYPWKTLVVSQLKKFKLPLWNPYNLAGAPLAANFQSGSYYPLNIFYLIFPQKAAWTILVILQPLLAMIFTYLLLRQFNFHILASLLGGLTFGYSNFFTVWLEYNTVGQVILWLPLVLLALEKLLKRNSPVWNLILIGSLFSSLTAGHPQIFFYLWLVALFYYLFRSRFGRDCRFIVLDFILPLGIGALQLVPGVELISQSARTVQDYSSLVNRVLLQPYQLIMFFIPDFFGNPATRNYWLSDTYLGKICGIGIVPLVMLIWVNWKNPRIKFFTLLAAGILILVTKNPLTSVLYRIPWPILATSSPTLATFLITFSLSVLVANGMHHLLTAKSSFQAKYPNLLILTGLFLIMGIFSFIAPYWQQIPGRENLQTVGVKQTIYGSGLFFISLGGIWLLSKLKRHNLLLVACFLIMISVFELNRYFLRFNPFVPPSFVFPQHEILTYLKDQAGINRYWGYGNAAIDANFATQYQIFSPDGYDPLYPKRYGEFIQTSVSGHLPQSFTGRTRSDAVLVPGYGESDLSANLSRLRIMDLLGVKYVLDRTENNSNEITFPPDRFKLIYVKDDWKILENLLALPRIFLASNYRVFADSNEFEKIFFDSKFNPRETVLLEEALNEPLTSADNGQIALVDYQPSIVTLSVRADSRQLLFLSDVYSPGWQATIDKKPTKIYRADYTFRALVVPAGEHRIEFRYHPLSFRVGILISLISCIFTILFFCWTKKHEK